MVGKMFLFAAIKHNGTEDSFFPSLTVNMCFSMNVTSCFSKRTTMYNGFKQQSLDDNE